MVLVVLVGHKSFYIGKDEPYRKLFDTVWFDKVDGHRYRSRFGELLEGLKDTRLSEERHMQLFAALFEAAGEPIVRFISGQMLHPNEEVREGAATFLGAIVRTRGYPHFTDKTHEPAFRTSALSALTTLTAGADQPSAVLAAAAIRRMFRDLEEGSWGPLESRPYIETLTRSSSKDIASLAKACLKRFDKERRWTPGG